MILSRGGFDEFAERTDLGKSSLYRILDTDGYHRLSGIRGGFGLLGIEIRVDAA